MYKVGDQLVINYEELVNVEGTVTSLTDTSTAGYPVEIQLHDEKQTLVGLTSDFKMWRGDEKSCIRPYQPVEFEL